MSDTKTYFNHLGGEHMGREENLEQIDQKDHWIMQKAEKGSTKFQMVNSSNLIFAENLKNSINTKQNKYWETGLNYDLTTKTKP